MFYLRPSTGGLAGFAYDPATGKERFTLVQGLAKPDAAWDRRYTAVYWFNGESIRSASWTRRPKAGWAAVLPAELGEPAAWWIERGQPRVARLDAEKAELWRRDPTSAEWRLADRQRFLGAAEPERRARAEVRAWAAAGDSRALEELVAEAWLGSRLGQVRWSGGPASGEASWPIVVADGCWLKFKVARDEEGAHALAPLIHFCRGRERGRVIFDAQDDEGAAKAGFAGSGGWLLAGREPDMRGALLVGAKDGKAVWSVPAGGAYAAWVPCP